MLIKIIYFEQFFIIWKGLNLIDSFKFESRLVKIIDKIAPLEHFSKQNVTNSNPPAHIKYKINKRSRLLKKMNKNPTSSIDTRQTIKQSKH